MGRNSFGHGPRRAAYGKEPSRNFLTTADFGEGAVTLSGEV